MSTPEDIRLHYPLPIARAYETAQLETEPRQRVRKLIDLYERTAQYLVLAGLACCAHLEVADPQVEALRPGLERPSLGHWVELLKALSRALRAHGLALLTAQPGRAYQDDALSAAMAALAQVLDASLPKKILLHHWLDMLVEFRNKRIGHGALSLPEAKTVVTPLEAGLVQWLGELELLHQRHLVHVARVEWQPPRFAYSGTHLNAGVSLYPIALQGEEPLTPERVYLHDPETKTGGLVPLHPFFHYDSDVHLLYAYSELDAQGRPLLRCPYEAPGAEGTYTLDLEGALILGSDALGAPVQKTVETPGQETTFRTSPATVKEKGPTTMANWFDIIQPHEDIRQGDFNEAIFAADLGDVADGSAPPDYADPYTFFRKTYLTDGLQHLLARVHDKLAAGRGQSVIEIQTPFGGGKTHSLVALYHYLVNGAQVRELLPTGLELFSPNVSAIVGTHHNPVEGERNGGVLRRTLWGELGYQLGGREGYRFFAHNDESRVSPGKSKLREFLAARQPCILLFDEILEYVNRAAGVAYEDTTLASQCYAFFQELTETVAALPRAMMVVTLPSSYLEDYGERQEESLARLNKIFGRVESIETPVQGEEVYAVVRRRLFEVEGLHRAAMNEVVYRYMQAYAQHGGDLPAKVRNLEFKKKMELAYPFHPDVIDILYEKWSTFSSFQRTRGVLRLLANVVEDLYGREANVDVILPGDLNLGRPSIRQELLKHTGIEYEGVIGSDIAGHEAKAQAMDERNRAWKHLAERVATALFFHSFSADDSERGISLPYIKLAAMRSDTLPSMVTEVLGRLSNTLWYLNSRADVHYFSRIPNLNRMILDKKELFNESYEGRLRAIVEAELGNKLTPYAWPENGDKIPDNRALKLVVLHPEDAGADIPAWVERKGETFRVYKNTLVFALADTAAFARLRDQVKTLMALEEIQSEIDAGQSPALETKRDEVRRRTQAIARDLNFDVRRMYHTLQVGGRRIDLGQPVAGNETLSGWYWRELEEAEEIAARLHYRMLVQKFVVPAAERDGGGTVATQAVLDQFYKEPALPAPASPEIVARAIQLGVQDGAFGLAALQEGEIDPRSLRFGVEVPLGGISFEEGFVLVERGRAEAILAALRAAEAAETAGADTGTIELPEPGEEPEGGAEPGDEGDMGGTPPPVTHYKRVRLVIEGVPAGRIADVNRGILMPISRAVGDFTFTLTVDVSDEEGIARSTLEQTVKETVRQIGARVTEERAE